VTIYRREEGATASRGGIHNSWLAKLREKLPAASTAPLHQVTLWKEEGATAGEGIHNSWLAKLRENIPAASAAPLHQVTIFRREEGATALGSIHNSWLAKFREKLPLAASAAPLHQGGKRTPPPLEGALTIPGLPNAKLREKLLAASAALLNQVTICRREECAIARGGIHNSWLAKLREKLSAFFR
jgi:hypothetical protein